MCRMLIVKFNQNILKRKSLTANNKYEIIEPLRRYFPYIYI